MKNTNVVVTVSTPDDWSNRDVERRIRDAMRMHANYYAIEGEGFRVIRVRAARSADKKVVVDEEGDVIGRQG